MKTRIWWLIAAGVLLMGVGMTGSVSVLNAGAGQTIPDMDLISATAGIDAARDTALLSLDDIVELQSSIEGSKFSLWANGQGALAADTRSTQADIFAVTGAFQDFHHMDLLYGSFLPRTEAGGMAAVLDSDLAYRLFGTLNAVGMEVTFSGKTFEVCGVCRTDTSLLGLMSGNGYARAYLCGYDLIATDKLLIGGFEAALPHGVPGQSLQSVKAAMQTLGVPTGSFLLKDLSEQKTLDTEVSLIPMVITAVSAMLIVLVFFIRTARGIARESWALLRENYLSAVWPALLGRFAKALALLAACAGISWLLWSSVGLHFYLPSKYIPGSWIDGSFYTALIQSESQAAIAAQAYPRPWWETVYAGSVALGTALNTVAFIGFTVTALSLRALWADRRLPRAFDPPAKATGLWDAPVLWLLALLSFGATLGLAACTGLPPYTRLDGTLALAISLGVWALAINNKKVESVFFRKPENTVFQ